MRRAIAVVVLLIVIVGAAVANLLIHGVSARDEPTRIEAVLARSLRHFAVPWRMRAARNPLPLTAAALREGREHFADHCAQCHGNDGRGQTEMGRSLYPRSPDMTLTDTQNLSDGELFAIIRNGVRLTGMPGWGGDDAENWKLVLFVRHLSKMTKEEADAMRVLNPVSRSEMREEQEEREFLNGKENHP